MFGGGVAWLALFSDCGSGAAGGAVGETSGLGKGRLADGASGIDCWSGAWPAKHGIAANVKRTKAKTTTAYLFEGLEVGI